MRGMATTAAAGAKLYTHYNLLRVLRELNVRQLSRTQLQVSSHIQK